MEGRHFGVMQTLTSRIVEFNSPNFFVDEMVDGIFKSLRHEHHFQKTENVTEMKDIFHYNVPFGSVGRLFDRLVFKAYMTQLLTQRNKVIKAFAETNKWKEIL